MQIRNAIILTLPHSILMIHWCNTRRWATFCTATQFQPVMRAAVRNRQNLCRKKSPQFRQNSVDLRWLITTAHGGTDYVFRSFSATQARMVAAATSSLCEAANASVQGHASEEKLISSAKQVAASTAQLLVACKVKADHDSEAMRRLQV